MRDIKDVFLPNIEKDYINNCKISQQIITIKDPFSKIMRFRTIPKKNISASVTIDPDTEEIMGEGITFFDRIVMDSVYTLYVNGQDMFTAEMIMRVMSGNHEADSSRKKTDLIRSSLEKLSSIKIQIDCTEEMIARKLIKKGQSYKIQTYLLPLEKHQVRSGNHLVIMDAYKILKKPALYEYAEAIKQFVTVPSSVLGNSHKSISDSVEVIEIKRYLIIRIEEMKHPGNGMVNDLISYHWYDAKAKKNRGMYPVLGYGEDISSCSGRKLRSNIHRKVIRILDYYKEIGYIAGYEVVYEGKQKIKGVRIILPNS